MHTFYKIAPTIFFFTRHSCVCQLLNKAVFILILPLSYTCCMIFGNFYNLWVWALLYIQPLVSPFSKWKPLLLLKVLFAKYLALYLALYRKYWVNIKYYEYYWNVPSTKFSLFSTHYIHIAFLTCYNTFFVAFCWYQPLFNTSLLFVWRSLI